MHINIAWVTHFGPTTKIKANMFEDDENKATIVAQSKQSVNVSVKNLSIFAFSIFDHIKASLIASSGV